MTREALSSERLSDTVSPEQKQAFASSLVDTLRESGRQVGQLVEHGEMRLSVEEGLHRNISAIIDRNMSPEEVEAMADAYIAMGVAQGLGLKENA